MPKKIIIIGAGYGGLSAAALLAKQGHEVTVLEKNAEVGGRGRVWLKDGFSFDMGPSWYLMPDVFEKFFAELGEKVGDYYKLQRLDPAYRIFLQGGKQVDISADLEKNIELFDKLEPNGAEQFKKYLAQSQYQYEVAMKDFIYKEYNSLTDMFNFRMAVEGSKLHVFETMGKYTQRYFKNPDTRKILEYTLVFLGGSPSNIPAMYSLMSHIDFNMGVWYPRGGLGAVAAAIHKIAKKNGARFLFNTTVKKIETANGQAKAVETDSGRLEADIVVSNADYAFTELELLDKPARSYSKKYWDKRVYAPSAFMVFLGLDKRLPGLTHHNLFFEHDWQKHFDEIFNNPQWPKEPSYYVCTPSVTDESIAPVGKENMFILVPVAAGLDDNDQVREEFFEKTMNNIEATLGENIRKHIMFKRIYSQRDFASDYFSYKGTALGLSHTFMQTALFRPKQRSKKVSNLFYTGQYTHPGVGVPMVIIASQILAKLIEQHD